MDLDRSFNFLSNRLAIKFEVSHPEPTGTEMKKLMVASALIALLCASPAFAATDTDCAAAFTAADTNKDGVISEAEAGRYYAAHRIAGKPITDDKLTRDMFMTNCKADVYVETKAESGAPIAGANSFTETQAQDRALKAGFSKVSTLKKDDKGIWRGTANMGDKQVNVAIDFKGNVVSN